jgi:hypothetical protein
MPRYRARSAPVAAEQFLRDQPWPACVHKTMFGHAFKSQNGFPVEIRNGDWVVTHDNGTMLRIKGAIFPLLYEPLSEEN